MLNRVRWILILLMAGVAAGPAGADTLAMPLEGDSVVGELFSVQARGEDTLLDIGRRYGLGRDEIVNANPGVDTWLPGAGTDVLVPRQYVLPDVPREGVVLNLPEMRLYHFQAGAGDALGRVTTHPISIGRQDWRTPLGESRIISKVRNPTWYPPASVRAEHAADGDPLPAMVPAGPDNPLGGYAMRLDIPGYLIHGTNKPYGVGMRVSHGCIRMFPEDIVSFFDEIPTNTPVRLINQPVKAGWTNGELMLEVHPPLEEDTDLVRALPDMAFSRVREAANGRAVSIDTRAVRAAVERRDGVPVVVAREAGNLRRAASDAGRAD